MKTLSLCLLAAALSISSAFADDVLHLTCNGAKGSGVTFTVDRSIAGGEWTVDAKIPAKAYQYLNTLVRGSDGMSSNQSDFNFVETADLDQSLYVLRIDAKPESQTNTPSLLFYALPKTVKTVEKPHQTNMTFKAYLTIYDSIENKKTGQWVQPDYTVTCSGDEEQG